MVVSNPACFGGVWSWNKSTRKRTPNSSFKKTPFLLSALLAILGFGWHASADVWNHMYVGTPATNFFELSNVGYQCRAGWTNFLIYSRGGATYRDYQQTHWTERKRFGSACPRHPNHCWHANSTEGLYYRGYCTTDVGENPMWVRPEGASGVLPNLFLNKAATASRERSSTYAAAKLTDGNLNSWWGSPDLAGQGDKERVQIDMGSVQKVSEILILLLQTHRAARDYKFEFSNDGTTWRTGTSVRNDPAHDVSYKRTARVRMAEEFRYVRIELGNLEWHNSYKYYGVWEIEAYYVAEDYDYEAVSRQFKALAPPSNDVMWRVDEGVSCTCPASKIETKTAGEFECKKSCKDKGVACMGFSFNAGTNTCELSKDTGECTPKSYKGSRCYTRGTHVGARAFKLLESSGKYDSGEDARKEWNVEVNSRGSKVTKIDYLPVRPVDNFLSYLVMGPMRRKQVTFTGKVSLEANTIAGLVIHAGPTSYYMCALDSSAGTLTLTRPTTMHLEGRNANVQTVDSVSLSVPTGQYIDMKVEFDIHWKLTCTANGVSTPTYQVNEGDWSQFEGGQEGVAVRKGKASFMDLEQMQPDWRRVTNVKCEDWQYRKGTTPLHATLDACQDACSVESNCQGCNFITSENKFLRITGWRCSSSTSDAGDYIIYKPGYQYDLEKGWTGGDIVAFTNFTTSLWRQGQHEIPRFTGLRMHCPPGTAMAGARFENVLDETGRYMRQAGKCHAPDQDYEVGDHFFWTTGVVAGPQHLFLYFDRLRARCPDRYVATAVEYELGSCAKHRAGWQSVDYYQKDTEVCKYKWDYHPTRSTWNYQGMFQILKCAPILKKADRIPPNTALITSYEEHYDSLFTVGEDEDEVEVPADKILDKDLFSFHNGYLGCYTDGTGNERDLPVAIQTPVQSIAECGRHCAAFLYFSVQHGTQCRCGNAYARNATVHKPVDNAECRTGKKGLINNKCRNLKEPCGGPYRQAVYMSEEYSTDWRGCFEIDRNDYAVKVINHANDPRELNSVGECAKHCKEGNYRYYGTSCPKGQTLECTCHNVLTDQQETKNVVRLRTKECAGFPEHSTHLHGGSNGECSGPFHHLDGKMATRVLGGKSRAAIRRVPLGKTEEFQPKRVFENYNYYGCYADPSYEEDLFASYERVANTLDECASSCSLKQRTFFAIKGEFRCYCIEAFDERSDKMLKRRVSDEECYKGRFDTSCGYHKNYPCGGGRANAVYSTTICKEAVHSGDLTVTKAFLDQNNNLPCKVDGNFIIGTDLSDADFVRIEWNSLTEITKTFKMEETSLTMVPPLNRLKIIGAEFRVSKNSKLKAITLPALKRVEHSFHVEDNDDLEGEVLDIPMMQFVGGDFRVQCNGDSGVLLRRTNLEDISGMVYINDTQKCPQKGLKVKSPKCTFGMKDNGFFDPNAMQILGRRQIPNLKFTLADMHEKTASGASAPYNSPKHFGENSIAYIGDVNGDGHGDVAIGHFRQHRVYILFLDKNQEIESHTHVQVNSYFGSSVATAGDYDGDNVPDIVVGAYAKSSSRGTAFLVLLNRDGSAKKIVDIFEGYDFQGKTHSSSNCGGSVSFIHSSHEGQYGMEFTATRRLAVGCYAYDKPVTDVGSVLLLDLDEDGKITKHMALGPETEEFEPALLATSYFGFSLAAIGDLDGDFENNPEFNGDLAVGCPLDSRINVRLGTVFIYTFNTDGSIKRRSMLRSSSPNVHDWFGSQVASLGDLDKDGIVDLAVSSRYSDAQRGTNSGDVYLLFLQTDGTVKNSKSVTKTEVVRAYDSFGWSLGTDALFLNKNKQSPSLELAAGRYGEHVRVGVFFHTLSFARDRRHENIEDDPAMIFAKHHLKAGILGCKCQYSPGGYNIRSVHIGDFEINEASRRMDIPCFIDGNLILSYPRTGVNVESVYHITGDLIMNWGSNLKEFPVFRRLQRVDGDIKLMYNDLESVRFPELQRIGGGIFIQHHPKLNSESLRVPALAQINGEIEILCNGFLVLDRFEFLERVDGTVTVTSKECPMNPTRVANQPCHREALLDVYKGTNKEGLAKCQCPVESRHTGNFTVTASSTKIPCAILDGSFHVDAHPAAANFTQLIEVHGNFIVNGATANTLDFSRFNNLAYIGGNIIFTCTSGQPLPRFHFLEKFKGVPVVFDEKCPEVVTPKKYEDCSPGLEDTHLGEMQVLSFRRMLQSEPKLQSAITQDARFGQSMAQMDPLDDSRVLIVGAPREYNQGVRCGVVRFLYMDEARRVKYHNLLSIAGIQASGEPDILRHWDYFGQGVTQIGDVNGDGTPDIAVTAVYDDIPNPLEKVEGEYYQSTIYNLGKVYVIFLKTETAAEGRTYQYLSHKSIDYFKLKELGFHIWQSDYFGMSISGIGDINGDNVPDIAVGAPLDDDNRWDRGAVYILMLDETGSAIKVTKINDASFREDIHRWFGWSITNMKGLAGPGTVVNNLNLKDTTALAVGFPLSNTGVGHYIGGFYILYLDSDGKMVHYVRNDAKVLQADWQTNDRCGFSVSNIGDYNNDGIDDLAVGCQDVGLGLSRGKLYIIPLHRNGTHHYLKKVNYVTPGFSSALTGATFFLTDEEDIHNGDSEADPEIGQRDLFGYSILPLANLKSKSGFGLVAGAVGGRGEIIIFDVDHRIKEGVTVCRCRDHPNLMIQRPNVAADCDPSAFVQESGWMNNFRKKGALTIADPGRAVVTVDSFFIEDDRIWKIGHAKMDSITSNCNDIQLNSAESTNLYKSPNGALVGWSSTWDRLHSDRLYTMRWCDLAPKHTATYCEWSLYSFPKVGFREDRGKFFFGVDTIHEKDSSDRRWSYYLCKIVRCSDCATGYQMTGCGEPTELPAWDCKVCDNISENKKYFIADDTAECVQKDCEVCPSTFKVPLKIKEASYSVNGVPAFAPDIIDDNYTTFSAKSTTYELPLTAKVCVWYAGIKVQGAAKFTLKFEGLIDTGGDNDDDMAGGDDAELSPEGPYELESTESMQTFKLPKEQCTTKVTLILEASAAAEGAAVTTPKLFEITFSDEAIASNYRKNCGVNSDAFRAYEGICVACNHKTNNEYYTGNAAVGEQTCPVATCKSCEDGEFVSKECGRVNNRQCQPCLVCPEGDALSGCSKTSYSQGSCAACPNPPEGYRNKGHTAFQAACKTEKCTSCTANQYRSSGCEKTFDSVCSACTDCGNEKIDHGGCTGTTDRICVDPPKVTSVQPAVASQGTVITISGERLFATDMTVRVGDQNCANVQFVSSGNKLTCVAPLGNPGKPSPVVAAYKRKEGTSDVKLGYSAPQVTSISPGNGPTEGGIKVTIIGSNFKGLGATTVKIGGKDCAESGSISHFQIICLLPAGTGKDVEVKVEIVGGVAATFKYSYMVPKITDLSMSALPTEGARVTVTGTNFGAPGDMAKLIVNKYESVETYQVDATVISSTELTATIKEGVGREIGIAAVINGNEGPNVLKLSYAAPSFSKIDPLVVIPGDSITLEGENFGVDASHATIRFNGVSLSSSAVSAYSHKKIIITVPVGVGQDVEVSLTVGGQSVSQKGIKYGAPEITNIDHSNNIPTSGSTQDVVLTGTQFSTSGSLKLVGAHNTITDNIVITHHTDTQLKFKMPPGGGKDFVVIFVRSDGAESSSDASVSKLSYAPPEISSTSPSRASTIATELAITGKNFGDTATVQYDGQQLVVLSRNYTQIRVRLTGTTGAGIKLQVKYEHQVAEFSIDTANPIVTACEKNTGGSAGGESITVSGSNFGTTTVAGKLSTEVTIGGVKCMVTSSTFDKVVCRTPELNKSAKSQPSDKNLIVLATVNSLDSNKDITFSYEEPLITTQFSPITTAPGVVLVLEGRSFGAAQGVVKIDGVEVEQNAIRSWGHNRIELETPDGKGGQVLVQITTEFGRLQNVEAKLSYNPPAIISVTPSTIGTSGTGKLTITGENFGVSGRTNAAVGMGSNACTIDSLNHTQIVCSYSDLQNPHGDFAKGFGDVSVTVEDVKSAGVTLGFSNPVIKSLDPSNGNTLNQLITIHGDNFGGTSDFKTKVLTKAGNYACSGINVTTVSSITCKLMSGINNVELRVEVLGKSSGTFTFTYDAPKIVSILPASPINVDGTEKITITGRNFAHLKDQVKVIVGGVEWVVESLSDHDKIIAKSKPGVGLGHRVVVQVGSARSEDDASMKVDYKAPIINTLRGIYTTEGGSIVTIDGAHFGSDAQVGTLFVNGKRVDTATYENTKITFHLPAGAGKGIPVRIEVASQLSNPEIFNYVGPSINSIKAASNSTEGGYALTLTGSNFFNTVSADYTVSVAVDGMDCPLITHKHTEITCRVPPSAGAVSVKVHVQGQTVEFGERFTYGAISFVSLKPRAYGPTDEKLLLQIEGSNFGPPASQKDLQQSVTVGSYTCEIREWGHSKVTCRMPEGAGKDLNVALSRRSESKQSFTFSFDAPIVDRIEPIVAKAGAVLTLTGKNFGEDNALRREITVGGQVCTDPACTAHTQCTCTIPNGWGNGLVVQIKVGSEGGAKHEQSSTWNKHTFSYPDPVINKITATGCDATAVSIENCPLNAEQVITISGSDLACTSTGCAKSSFPQEIKINFAPSSVDVPNRYYIDHGEYFGKRDSSFQYGWNCLPTPKFEEKSNDLIKDSVLVTSGGGCSMFGMGSWELSVPRGSYNVTVEYSDPTAAMSTDGCMLEGLHAGVGTVSSQTSKEKSIDNVEVKDGRLTFGIGTGCDGISSIVVKKNAPELTGAAVVFTKPVVDSANMYPVHNCIIKTSPTETNKLVCTLPQNDALRGEFEIQVQSWYRRSNTIVFGYASPVVDSLYITFSGNEVANFETGEKTLFISGEYFLANGRTASDIKVKYDIAGTANETAAIYDCTVDASKSDINNIKCDLDETAQGKDLVVRVFDGIQWGAESITSFRYAKPELLDRSLKLNNSNQEESDFVGGHSSSGDTLTFKAKHVPIDPKDLTVYYGVTSNPKAYQCRQVAYANRANVYEVATVSCKTELYSSDRENLQFTVMSRNQASAPSTFKYSYPEPPTVTKVSGCTDDGIKTKGCSSKGGTVLTITGTKFTENSAARVDGIECVLESTPSPTSIKCKLAAGVGKDLPVVVSSKDANGGTFASLPYPYVSFSPPSVTGIQGCENSDATGGSHVSGCERDGTSTITIIGKNFGPGTNPVIIDVCGTRCTNVNHDSTSPHEKVTCIVPKGTQLKLNVVLTAGGVPSSELLRVSYKQCAAGRFQRSLTDYDCADCARGKYTDTEGFTQCKPCEGGKFSNIEGSSTCSDCVAGKYQPEYGSSTCLECTKGKYSPPGGGAIECSPCDPGTYAKEDSATECLPCDRGTYADKISSESCTKCQIGFMAPNQKSVACTACEPGSHANSEGSPTCTECLEGTFKSSTGPGECVDCDVGSYTMTKGQASCTPCTGGKYAGATGASTCESCLPGRFSSIEQGAMKECLECVEGTHTATSEQTSCVQCLPGRFASTKSATTCEPCAAGKFVAYPGATACDSCEADFASVRGSTECKKCPAGKEALGDMTDCVDCTAGRYGEFVGGKCEACPPGRATNSSNQAVCKICAPGTFSASVRGSKVCAQCPAGKYSTSEQTQCLGCDEGTYTPTNSSSKCYECAPGKYSQGSNATKCEECTIGRYQNLSKQRECLPAPKGAFANKKGMVNPIPCQAGMYNNEEGSGECIECGVGKYQDKECKDLTCSSSMTSCKPCDPGTYANSTMQTTCNKCAAGKSQPDTEGTFCDPCAKGEYQDVSGSQKCNACAPGRFSDRPGSYTCQACPPGRFANSTGMSDCYSCKEGTYNPDSGRTACTSCAPGHYTAREASLNCLRCDVGKYQAEGGSPDCKPCEEGRYQPAFGQPGCTKCEQAKYQDKRGQSSCSECEEGKFNNDQEQLTCKICDAGKVSVNDQGFGATECRDCKPGRFSVEGAGSPCEVCAPGKICNSTTGCATECNECPRGKYQDASEQTQCIPCEPGTYASEIGRKVCNLCPGGQYQTLSGQSACQSCKPGYFCEAGSTKMTPCPNDDIATYSKSDEQNFCLACPKGTATSLTGQKECQECPPGFYAGRTGLKECIACPVGYFTNSSGSLECTPCGVGEYAEKEQSRSCTPCDIGKFQPDSKGSSCTECPRGKFAGNTGSQNCNECAPGKFASSSNSANCTECDAGKYAQTPGKYECDECPVGKAVAVEGQATCTTCAEGKYNNLNGKEECLSCEPGTYSRLVNVTSADPTAGVKTCKKCTPGKYAANKDQSECVECPAGQYQDESGQAYCNECSAGWYQPASSQIACLACGDGKISTSRGQSNCVECPLGFFQAELGQRECEACAPGKYSDEISQVTCKLCPEGTYQKDEGQPKCLNCPLGKQGLSAGDRIECQDCGVGTYKDIEGEGNCEICPVGKYQSGLGQSGCMQCLGGTYAAGTGAIKCSVCGPAKYSLNGANTCELCPAGSDSVQGSKECTMCDSKSVAAKEGYICKSCGEGRADSTRTKCLCPEGFALKLSPPDISRLDGDGKIDENDPGKCVLCPEGAVCDEGTEWSELKAKPGWFQGSSTMSTINCDDGTCSEDNFYKCVYESHCPGGSKLRTCIPDPQEPGSVKCSTENCPKGRTGMLCLTPEEGYAFGVGGSMVECEPTQGESVLSFALIGAGLVLFILLCYAFVLWFYSKTWQDMIKEEKHKRQGADGFFIEEVIDYKVTRHEIDEITIDGSPAPTPNLYFKWKILISFFQVVVIMPKALDIEWPEGFKKFVQLFAIINLDFLELTKYGCVMRNPLFGGYYYSKVFLVCLVPIGMLIVLTLVFLLPMYLKHCGRSEMSEIERKVSRRKWWKLVMYSVFMVYPFVCSSLFGTFVCRYVEGVPILVADARDQCYTESWNRAIMWVVPLCIVYPFGTPLFLYRLLKKYERAGRLDEVGVRGTFGFMYDAYYRACWYFDLMDMLHKLMLTSVGVFFAVIPQKVEYVFLLLEAALLGNPTSEVKEPVLSSDAAVVSILITLTYTILMLRLHPWLRKSDDRLALLSCSYLMLLMLVSINIRSVGYHEVKIFVNIFEMEMNVALEAFDWVLSIVMIILVMLFVTLFVLQTTKIVLKTVNLSRRKNGLPEYDGIGKLLQATTFKKEKTSHHKKIFEDMNITHKRTKSNKDYLEDQAKLAQFKAQAKPDRTGSEIATGMHIRESDSQDVSINPNNRGSVLPGSGTVESSPLPFSGMKELDASELSDSE